MPTIFVNFTTSGDDADSKLDKKLTTENFIEGLEEHTSEMDKEVKLFKKFINFVKTKNIKILEAGGLPFYGTFKVDEIDAERLKKAKIVFEAEYSDDPKKLPIGFFIDKFSDDKFGNDASELIGKRDDTPIFEVEMDEDEIEEKSSLLNLSEVIHDHSENHNEEDEDFSPGTLVVDVKQVGEHQYSFNLIVADLNEDPLEVKFDREKGQFEYKCNECDNVHIETLPSVFRSLKTTTALLSNLIAMIRNPKELGLALEFIDHDLRLLQNLLVFDYALNDDEGLVKDDEEDEDINDENDE